METLFDYLFHQQVYLLDKLVSLINLFTSIFLIYQVQKLRMWKTKHEAMGEGLVKEFKNSLDNINENVSTILKRYE